MVNCDGKKPKPEVTVNINGCKRLLTLQHLTDVSLK